MPLQLPSWVPPMPELSSKQWTAALAGGVVSLGFANYLRNRFFRSSKLPPLVPALPFIGCAVSFGERPIDFLMDCTKKYGPVFSFTMFGQSVTYLMGSEASTKFWSSDNDDLNAEDLYANITRPVFGPGVAFDVNNKVFSEQKRVAKTGLTQERFARYTALIESETHDFIQKRWGGKTGKTDLYHDLAEMVIFTATRTLHGVETRSQFDEEVAQYYHDLDGGFSPLAWFFPSWVPFPSFLKRDRAHLALKKRFQDVIQSRIDSGKVAGHDDLLETFMTSKYENANDGRAFNADETSGLLIALLMAGQHTSSTVASWLGFFIAQNQELQEELYKEQMRIVGPNRTTSVTLEEINQMTLLWACVRETLRLRPPIMTMMRKCRRTFNVTANGREYVIPQGDQVCVSPTINGRLESEWDNANTFDPSHFLQREADGTFTVTQGEGEKGGKFKWVPFGAGRHRCIGFEFGQIQIRTIFSYIIRHFRIKLFEGKFPPINFQTMIHVPMDPYITYERRA